MTARQMDNLCYLVCLVSLSAWAILSCVLVWCDAPFFGRTGPTVIYSLVGKWWITCFVVFITSALVLRLNKTYFEKSQSTSDSVDVNERDGTDQGARLH